MINFWATWCGPCKIETPWLVELRNQYASQGFEILGISTEDDDLADNEKGWAKDKAAIARFAKQEHMSYPVLINGDSISNTLWRTRRHAHVVLRRSHRKDCRRATRHYIKGRHGRQHP